MSKMLLTDTSSTCPRHRFRLFDELEGFPSGAIYVTAVLRRPTSFDNNVPGFVKECSWAIAKQQSNTLSWAVRKADNEYPVV